MNKWKKKLTALLTLTVFLLGVMVQPALALDFGVYTAPANTYYKNPETGEIEDGGTRNEELGEGMCRSAVGETALIEVDAKGNVYVTMRMLLYSNLSKIKFYVQEKPGGAYNQVKASITAEDSTNDSADFRLKMPSAGANVKTVMYVAPMSRDVTFFWNVSESSAQSGNGDFAVNINLNTKPKVEEPKQEEVKQEPAKTTVSEPVKAEVNTEPAATAEPVKTETQAQSGSVKEETASQEPVQNETVKEQPKQQETQQTVNESAANEPEVSNPANEGTEQEQDTESSDQIDNTAAHNEAAEDDKATEENNDIVPSNENAEVPDEESALPIVPIVCVTAVAAVGAVVMMRKK